MTLQHCHSLPQPPIRKTDAWRHQLEMYHYAFPMRAAMMPCGMGSGKSRFVVDIVVNRGHKHTLILCPKSVLNVWPREFRKHAGEEVDVIVLDGKGSKDKAHNLTALLQFARLSPRKLVVCINYESAWQPALANVLLKHGWDLIVADEIHRVKAPGGVASRFVAKLGKLAKYRLGLTGTPMPHSPLDVYAQYRFLDPSVYGTSFANFRARYAVTDRMFPSKVLSWINQDDLNEKFYRIACRRIVTADEIDLPPVQHIERYCALPAKAMRVYREIENEMVAEIEAGKVVAGNALVKLLRLQQVASGFVGFEDDDGEQRHEVLHDEKAGLLLDMLADLPLDEPVVVFCRFRHDLAAVMKVAARTGRRYGELSGRRRDLTGDATMPGDVDLFGVQIQAGGVGIDLTRAAYGVYLSLGFSLGDYEQSLARLHRPGQKRPVRFYHLLAEGTVDHAVYGALRKRKEVVESVLSSLTQKDGAQWKETEALSV